VTRFRLWFPRLRVHLARWLLVGSRYAVYASMDVARLQAEASSLAVYAAASGHLRNRYKAGRRVRRYALRAVKLLDEFRRVYPRRVEAARIKR